MAAAGPGAVDGLGRVTRGVDAAFAAVAMLLLVFVVCANGMEIVRRDLLNSSFLWLYEVNLLCSNWIYFLGMELVYYRNRDITLDFILLLLRGRGRVTYVIAVNAIGVITFAIVMFYALKLMLLQLPFRSSGIGLPNALFTAPVALACASFMLILIQQSRELWVRGELPRVPYAVSDAPE